MGMHVDNEGDTRMKMMENRMELMQEIEWRTSAGGNENKVVLVEVSRFPVMDAG